MFFAVVVFKINGAIYLNPLFHNATDLWRLDISRQKTKKRHYSNLCCRIKATIS